MRDEDARKKNKSMCFRGKASSWSRRRGRRWQRCRPPAAHTWHGLGAKGGDVFGDKTRLWMTSRGGLGSIRAERTLRMPREAGLGVDG